MQTMLPHLLGSIFVSYTDKSEKYLEKQNSSPQELKKHSRNTKVPRYVE